MMELPGEFEDLSRHLLIFRDKTLLDFMFNLIPNSFASREIVDSSVTGEEDVVKQQVNLRVQNIL